jgi:hypothetical protein
VFLLYTDGTANAVFMFGGEAMLSTVRIDSLPYLGGLQLMNDMYAFNLGECRLLDIANGLLARELLKIAVLNFIQYSYEDLEIGS